MSEPFVADDGRAWNRSLFSGVDQRHNFCRMHELFPASELTPSTKPHHFESGEPLALPTTFRYNGVDIVTADFLDDTGTSALVVVDNGHLRFEQYSSTGGPAVPWLSMSVAKSFVSTLVGIAVDDGLIADIGEPIDTYVPEVIGSAYEGVAIKHLLQMASGAAWNEVYSDRDSDVARLGRAFEGDGTLAELVGGIKNATQPGTVNLYNSAETQALGFLVIRATGQSITEFMQARLWEPLGMNHSAYWVLDPDNIEMAFGGFNAAALDYARLGELYRREGMWGDTQIVSKEWVQAATTPDAPYLMPGRPDDPFGLGYGYQWWVPAGDRGEYMAIGIYNQLIHVDPTAGTVIVKLSSNPTYGLTDLEEDNQELTSIELFRAIVDACGEVA